MICTPHQYYSGDPTCRWEDNIQMDLQEVGWGHELDWSGSGQEVAGTCKRGNNAGNFLTNWETDSFSRRNRLSKFTTCRVVSAHSAEDMDLTTLKQSKEETCKSIFFVYHMLASPKNASFLIFIYFWCHSHAYVLVNLFSSKLHIMCSLQCTCPLCTGQNTEASRKCPRFVEYLCVCVCVCVETLVSVLFPFCFVCFCAVCFIFVRLVWTRRHVSM
jgi:hypothetical protein